MKNQNSKKLKGNVAVITKDGEKLDFHVCTTKLTRQQASQVFDRFVTNAATLRCVEAHVIADDIEQLCADLWMNMFSTPDMSYPDKLPQFSDEVIAVLGSGNYVFDFNSTVIYPHKLSAKAFMDTIDLCEYLSSDFKPNAELHDKPPVEVHQL